MLIELVSAYERQTVPEKGVLMSRDLH